MPLKIGQNPNGNSSSKHSFSGAMLVSGRVDEFEFIGQMSVEKTSYIFFQQLFEGPVLIRMRSVNQACVFFVDWIL